MGCAMMDIIGQTIFYARFGVFVTISARWLGASGRALRGPTTESTTSLPRATAHTTALRMRSPNQHETAAVKIEVVRWARSVAALGVAPPEDTILPELNRHCSELKSVSRQMNYILSGPVTTISVRLFYFNLMSHQ